MRRLARIALVSLEDLWHETEPQNRKARFSLAEFSKRTEVVEPLARVNKLRKVRG